MNAVAHKCASRVYSLVANIQWPLGLASGRLGLSGPSEASTHTLAATRKNGLTPMRCSRYRHKATRSDITAPRVIKHLPAASQDVNGPHGKPNHVIAGGRMLTIAPPSPCILPDQKARLTAIALAR